MNYFRAFIDGPFHDFLRNAVTSHLEKTGHLEFACKTAINQLISNTVKALAEKEESINGPISIDTFRQECRDIVLKLASEIDTLRSSENCTDHGCMACRVDRLLKSEYLLSKIENSIPSKWSKSILWLMSTLRTIAGKESSKNRIRAKNALDAYIYFIAKSIAANEILEENAQLHADIKRLHNTIDMLTETISPNKNN